MSAVKTVALGVLIWGVAASTAPAAPFFGGEWTWHQWGQLGGVIQGSSVAPPSFTPAPPAPSDTPAAQTPAPAAAPVTVIPSNPPDFSPAISQPPAPLASPTYNGPADAFVNLGNGPYPEAGVLTSGGAQPWYDSGVAQRLYGGTPSIQQQADFDAKVLQTIQSSFQMSGVPVHLTLDPNAPAAHTMSVVSSTSNPQYPNAIGITDIGSNGFSFVDKFGQAQSVDELAAAIAHNVAHELMHSFGVPEQNETTGSFVDNPTTTWSILNDPSLKFSPTATSLLLDQNFQSGPWKDSATGAPQILGDVNIAPVPEPTTVVLWAAAGAGLVLYRRRVLRRRTA